MIIRIEVGAFLNSLEQNKAYERIDFSFFIYEIKEVGAQIGRRVKSSAFQEKGRFFHDWRSGGSALGADMEIKASKRARKGRKKEEGKPDHMIKIGSFSQELTKHIPKTERKKRMILSRTNLKTTCPCPTIVAMQLIEEKEKK